MNVKIFLTFTIKQLEEKTMDSMSKLPYFLDDWKANVEAAPECLFLTDDEHPQGVSRKQADELSGQVYAWLKKQGIGKEDFVLVCLPRGILIPISMLGVWKSGGAVTVVEDTYAVERIDFIRKDLGCKAVIDMSAWEEIMSVDSLAGHEQVEDHDAALAVYTSGTSGNPKGVLHEYGNFKMQMASGVRYQSTAELRFAFIAPLNFVAFYIAVIQTLTDGFHLYIVPYETVKNPSLLRNYYEENNILMTFLSPSLIRALKGKLPSCVKFIFTGSEPANGIFVENVKLKNKYSMSESFFSICEFYIDKPYEACPVGKPPHEGIHVSLLDEEGRKAADGEIGEVCVETPFFRGYIGLPELTRESLKDGVFHTGDLARRLADGNMVILGRKGDMIKINGNRIEPAEIEAAAKRSLSLGNVAAKGFVKPGHSFVALYYTGKTNINTNEARKELKKLLPYYMIPSYFIHLDELPLLPNGKLDRESLPEPDYSRFLTEYEAPANDMEKRIVQSFEQTLGMKRVSVNDDFYEIGGDSVHSIQAAELVGEPLFTVPLLYQHRTARKAAAAVLQEKENNRKGIEYRDGKAREHDQPLTPMQLFLMDNQLYSPKSTFCNVPAFWRMPKDQVDTARLLDAFRKVINNQPVLKSVIRVDMDLGFVQHYAPSLEPELFIEEITEEELYAIKDDLIRPFKIADRLLYRIRIFDTGKDIYVFLDVNHLFNDGTSMQILIKNLSDAYNGNELPPDRAYLYARDLNKWKLKDDYDEAKKWMQDKYDRKNWCRCISPDMDSRSARASAISCDFPAGAGEISSCLEKYSLSMNALCVMAALMTLRDYEQKTDIMVAWAYSGRDDVTFKDTVFPIIKELPVAVSFEEIVTIVDLIREVNEQIQKGIVYQKDSYIFDHTGIPVNSPFRVRTLGNMRQLKGIAGIDCKAVPLVNKGAASSLMNLQILSKAEGGEELRLTYNVHRYKEGTAQKVLKLFCENVVRIIHE